MEALKNNDKETVYTIFDIENSNCHFDYSRYAFTEEYCNATKASFTKETYSKTYKADIEIDLYTEKYKNDEDWSYVKGYDFNDTLQEMHVDLNGTGNIDDNLLEKVFNKTYKSCLKILKNPIDLKMEFRFEKGKDLSILMPYLNIELKDFEEIDEKLISRCGMFDLIKRKIKISSIKIDITLNICSHCKDRFLIIERSNLGRYIKREIHENKDKITELITKKLLVRRKHKMEELIYKESFVFDKKILSRYKIKNYFKCLDSSVFNITKKRSFSNLDYYGFKITEISNKLTDSDKLIEKFLIDNFKDEYNYISKDLESAFHRYDKYNMQISYETMLSILKAKRVLNIKNNKLVYLLLFSRSYGANLGNFSCYKDSLLYEFMNMTEKEILSKLKINYSMLDYLIAYYYESNYKYIYPFLNISYVKNAIKKEMKDIENIKENSGYSYLYNETMNFLSIYSKHNSNKRFLNQVYKYHEFLEDTGSMYSRVLKKNPNYEINSKDNIKKIHDDMSDRLTRIKVINKEIENNEFLENLFKEFSHDGIIYKNPKDTNELTRTGNKMKICVALYRQKVLDKKSFIVIGYKEDVPVTCLEFKKDKIDYRVIQVKKYDNAIPDNDEASSLLSLFEENNIEIQTRDLLNANRKEELEV